MRALRQACAIALGVAALLGSPAGAQEAPAAKDDPALKCNLRSRLDGPGDPRLERLRGTVELWRTPCSGAFVTLMGRGASERGLVLTSGHCLGRGQTLVQGRYAVPAPGEVLVQVEDDRAFTLNTGNAGAPRACIRADQVAYATLTGLDLAVFRLSETYEEIERRTGTRPLVISADAAVPPEMKVRIPSGLHQIDSSCATDRTVPGLREMLWTWGPTLRLAMTCDARPGASGSPVVRADSNEVIAVFGTVYDADGRPCELMNPCEIDDKGAVSVAEKGRPYGHFVHALYTCLDGRGNIDVGVAGCGLPRP